MYKITVTSQSVYCVQASVHYRRKDIHNILCLQIKNRATKLKSDLGHILCKERQQRDVQKR